MGIPNLRAMVRSDGGNISSSPDLAVQTVISGGGAVITTGAKPDADIYIPFDCSIVGWTILGDGVQSGSVAIDIWKDSYANFPPTIADTITASAKPAISSAAKAQSSTLTGWTTAVVAGSLLRFNVDSVSTFTSLKIILSLRRT